MKRVIFIFLTLFLYAASHTGVAAQKLSPPGTFVVHQINQLYFVERPKEGVENHYRGWQAHVMAWPEATPEEMRKFSTGLFESDLRDRTDKTNGNLIFVTHYFDTAVLPDGKSGWKTYRMAYAKRSGKWEALGSNK